MTPTHVRSIWISDFHLGTRHSRADELLDFLRSYESEYLFLVGDIIDGWALSRSWQWPQSHSDVIQKILRKARKGTSVAYIPGNHDAFARQYAGLRFGRVTVRKSARHTLLDGRTVLIVHGDEFDGIIRYAQWLQKLGAVAYGFALALNHFVNMIRGIMHRPYWSLSAYLKQRTKKALAYIDDFEQLVAEKAHAAGVEGVVCGHIHHADVRTMGTVTYMNCGDWVESCTALVERLDGTVELVRWLDVGFSGDGQSTRRQPEMTVNA